MVLCTFSHVCRCSSTHFTCIRQFSIGYSQAECAYITTQQEATPLAAGGTAAPLISLLTSLVLPVSSASWTRYPNLPPKNSTRSPTMARRCQWDVAPLPSSMGARTTGMWPRPISWLAGRVVRAQFLTRLGRLCWQDALHRRADRLCPAQHWKPLQALWSQPH